MPSTNNYEGLIYAFCSSTFFRSLLQKHVLGITHSSDQKWRILTVCCISPLPQIHVDSRSRGRRRTFLCDYGLWITKLVYSEHYSRKQRKINILYNSAVITNSDNKTDIKSLFKKYFNIVFMNIELLWYVLLKIIIKII